MQYEDFIELKGVYNAIQELMLIDDSAIGSGVNKRGEIEELLMVMREKYSIALETLIAALQKDEFFMVTERGVIPLDKEEKNYEPESDIGERHELIKGMAKDYIKTMFDFHNLMYTAFVQHNKRYDSTNDDDPINKMIKYHEAKAKHYETEKMIVDFNEFCDNS